MEAVPRGSSLAAILRASFRRSGFHGLLLPLPSCLTEVSCNSNHCVTSIAETPSSLSVVSLDQEQPPLFLPAGTVGGVHFLGNIKSKRKWGVSWLGSFSPCWNESAVPPLHTLQPVIFFYACQVCFLMYAMVTPKEGIEIWYERSFSKHLLCGRQPRNRKWVLCPQGTCHIRGEIKRVNKLGSF